MTAFFPTSIRPFSTKVDLVNTVMADHVNALQDEVKSIETVLSTGILSPDYSGSFSSSLITPTTLNARLKNIEAGLVSGVSTAPYVRTDGGSTITVNTDTTTGKDGLILHSSSGPNVVTISSISVSGSTTGITATLTAGVATVTVASTTGLVPGQTITKTSGTGVFGTSPTILTVDSTTQITLSVNHATAGTITFTAESTTATLTTSAAHGLGVNDTLTISGATATSGTGSTSQVGFNSQFTVATVPSTITFTVSVLGLPNVNSGTTSLSLGSIISNDSYYLLKTLQQVSPNALRFNIDYDGYPYVGSNKVLWVNSDEYNSIIALITAAQTAASNSNDVFNFHPFLTAGM